MITRNLEDLASDNDDRERGIRSVVRAGIGGGLLVSLSILALKCDLNKTYYDVNDRVGAVEQRVGHVEDGLEAVREGAQRSREKTPVYLEACYDSVAPGTYEVFPC